MKFNLIEFYRFYQPDLMLLCFFPILPPAAISILIFFFAFNRILYSINSNHKIIKKDCLDFLLYSGFILFSFFSILWSSDTSSYLSEIQPSITILAFLLIYFFCKKISITPKLLNSLFLILAVSMVIYTFFYYRHIIEGISVYSEMITGDQPIRELNLFSQLKQICQLKLNAVSYNQTPDYIGVRGGLMAGKRLFFVHHTYTGLIAVFSLLFLIKFFNTEKVFWKRFFILLLEIVLICFILIIDSKIPPLILILSAFIYFISKINLSIKKIGLVCGAIIFCGMIALVYFDFSLFQKQFNYDEKYFVLDFNRYNLYKSALILWIKSPILGYGIGDALTSLTITFNQLTNNVYMGTGQKLNTHSQFLYYSLVGGIVNLVLFLFTLYSITKRSFHSRNVLFICFSFIMLLGLSFENMLNRAWGTLFLSLLTFIFINIRKEDEVAIY